MPFKDIQKRRAYQRERYHRHRQHASETFNELYSQLSDEEKAIVDKQLYDFCLPHAQKLGTTVETEIKKFIKILNMPTSKLETIFGELMTQTDEQLF